MTKIIFIHPWKTGGTAIAKALEEQNLLWKPPTGTVLAKKLFNKILPIRLAYIHKHSMALEYETLVKEEWSTLPKVGAVRNPYDWLVSLYHYILQSSKDGKREHHIKSIIHNLTFDDYIEWVTNQHGLSEFWSRRNSPLRGKIIVNQSDWFICTQKSTEINIIKQEALDRQLNALLTSHGIEPVKLNKINTSERRGYKSYYNETLIKKVAVYFEEDLRRYCYAF